MSEHSLTADGFFTADIFLTADGFFTADLTDLNGFIQISFSSDC